MRPIFYLLLGGVGGAALAENKELVSPLLKCLCCSSLPSIAIPFPTPLNAFKRCRACRLKTSRVEGPGV